MRRSEARGPGVPVALATALVLGLSGCGGAEGAPRDEAAELPRASRSRSELPEDWERFREVVGWAWERRVDTLPMGLAVARIGEEFVGTAYQPHTLEVPGSEGLVINFQALDCVTFVENVLALARFVKTAPASVLDEEHVYKAYYRGILTNLRYRGGEIDGYPSRLHYFSEWISDNHRRGHLRNVTAEIGGVEDPEPLHFMTTHPDGYRQLAESREYREAIRRIEARLSGEGRPYVPQDRIQEIQEEIRTGDIIAATSTVKGLDVAHTGIAVWRGGELHLMHAPLVGDSVRISERTLAERIRAIGGQDGIMVARPLPPEGG